MGDLTLVLGGIRSGKSAFAEQLASDAGPLVLYLATGKICDEEMRNRVERHRERRPATWTTVEAPLDPIAALRSSAGGWDAVLLDSISNWIANLFFQELELGTEAPACSGEDDVASLIDGLVQSARASSRQIILVSDEVGLSLVATHPSGRRFQDLLGLANQWLASQSENVFLVAAGLPMVLKAKREPRTPPAP